MITAISYRTSFSLDLRLLALCLLAVLTPMIVAAIAPVLLALVAVALPVLGKLAVGLLLIAVFAQVTKP